MLAGGLKRDDRTPPTNKGQGVGRHNTTKRKPMEMEETFTAYIVTRAIKTCRNS